VSYTDTINEVGNGLGPEWDVPQYLFEGFSGASSSSIHPFNSAASIHAFVTNGDSHIVHLQIVITNGTNYRIGGYLRLPPWADNSTIGDVHVRCLSDTVFALSYSVYHNFSGGFTILHAGEVNPSYTVINMKNYIPLTDVPNHWGVVRYLQSSRQEGNTGNAWLLYLYASQEGHGCTPLFYKLDLSNSLYYLTQIHPSLSTGWGIQCVPPLAGYYLQQGYFVLVNAFQIAFSQINFAGNGAVSGLRTEPLGEHTYRGTLTVLNIIEQNLLVLAGSHGGPFGGPNAMTQVIKWGTSAPYLTVHNAVALLPTTQLAVYRDEIRACYVSPDHYHPNGAIIFTYVDNRTGLPMLVRGKLEAVNNYVWILPSPHLLVSTVPYYSFFIHNFTVGPQLICSPGNSRAGYLLQADPPLLNSFRWFGGYRLAGIAESSASGGGTVSITRIGIASTPYPAQAGFTYFAQNDGQLRSSLSLNEHFTPIGLPYRLGAAISQDQLVLDFEVIDRMNNAFW